MTRERVKRTAGQITGSLAAIAREVLDNGIWSGSYDKPGYEWRIVQPAGGQG